MAMAKNHGIQLFCAGRLLKQNSSWSIIFCTTFSFKNAYFCFVIVTSCWQPTDLKENTAPAETASSNENFNNTY